MVCSLRFARFMEFRVVVFYVVGCFAGVLVFWGLVWIFACLGGVFVGSY